MQTEEPSADLVLESVELSRALAELKEWKEERMRVLSDVDQYIQQALQMGKMTARRKQVPKRDYLTDRMIATLELDRNHFKRSILFMQVRERQISSRLNEIAALTKRENEQSRA